MKILITGGKTATALKLVKAFDGAEILLADYGEMPNINTSSYSFTALGVWNSEVLAHNLLTKCLDFGVDILLPLFKHEIAAVAKSLVLFDEFGIKVLVPQNPEFGERKLKDWCVFEQGKIIYASAETQKGDSTGLNGVYSYDGETNDFTLISIPDPL